MNYETTRALFKRGLVRRKLCHNTYAILGAQESIEIVFHRTTIIKLFPDESFELNNHGWTSSTTQDRYRRFLPHHTRHCSWRFRKHDRTHIWLLEAGGASQPWSNGVHWSPGMVRKDLPRMLRELNYRNFIYPTLAYAKEAIAKLYRGEIREDDTCEGCMGDETTTEWQEHLLWHLQANRFSSSFMRRLLAGIPRHGMRVADMLWKENQVLWRPARTNKALISRVERSLQMPDPYVFGDPVAYRKELRTCLENALLEGLGFELF